MRTAYSEGFEAYKAGEQLYTNPYDSDLHERDHQRWAEGWWDGWSVDRAHEVQDA